ncbi:MAG: hypothetical protein ABIG44_06010 [Planctomycetota bacterium]
MGRSLLWLFPLLGMLAVSAGAQPVMDGVAESTYCDAIVVQDTQTSFGDSQIGQYDQASGSELDGAFATVHDGILYLVFAGNLETNGNKLELFFDTRAGGQNQLLGIENPDVDYGALQRMGYLDAEHPGFKFETGFEADFYVTVTNYNNEVVQVHVSYAELYVDAGNPGVGYYLGQGLTRCETNGGELTGGNAPFTAYCTLDNSNTAGVDGGFGVGNGAGVNTGVELAIPLSALGDPTGDFKICAFINGQQHDFVSNQVLAGIWGNPSDHLGDPRLVDLSLIFWNQFFTVPIVTDPCGACCIGQTCSILTAAACAGTGGTYLGDGVSCDGNPCDTIPTGACCLVGLCEVMTSDACDTAGGAYLGDGTGCDIACDCLAYGACCVGTTCSVITEEDCTLQGGDFLGPFTDCSADPCATGACCVAGPEPCIEVREEVCLEQDGVYLGDGTDCTDDPCSQGACCIGNLCFIVRDTDCLWLGGVYQGDLTECLMETCGSPEMIPTIDGSCELLYSGPALSVQDTSTGFGDSRQGEVDFASGSELDVVRARIANGRVYICLAGNLESNYNKLELFFDTRPGGQNQLRGDNPDIDWNGLNRMGDDLNTPEVEGLMFDTVFEADFWMCVTGGSDPYRLYVNYAELYVDELNPGVGHYLGQGRAANYTHGGLLDRDPGAATPFIVLCTIDNSNVDGVNGTPPFDPLIEFPEDVTTGLEFSIPLEALAIPVPADPTEFPSLKVCVFVNGQSHNWMSNQVLGPLGGLENLVEPREVDFSAIDGDQWFGIEWCTGQLKGDSNCDGAVNSYDIDHFITAVGGKEAWDARWGTSCDFYCVNDMNGDNEVNSYDIDGFIAAVGGGG